MVLQPVGPEPPNVYWRRRALVVAGVLVVLVVLLKACTGAGGGKDASADPTADSSTPAASTGSALGGGLDDPSAAPSSGADASAAADPSGGPSTAPSSTPGATPAATPAPGGTCSDRQLRVVVGTDASAYRAGATPRLSFTVTNNSSTPCTRDVGTAALSLEVRSGPDRIWNSDDCTSKGSSSVRTLAAGTTFTPRSVTWSGKRSGPGKCGPGRARAKAGTYTVTARVGTLTSAPKRFVLR
ncbi:hypothetical protein CLV35_1703 [Motilibacter peucedani]|uniref:Uncharacterized protein n=1 Tax=Motilibacter peucedani TaxID=598650 RepID=A0A420XPS4_9ACTN|nr:hypothetical protein [Motilibacter peucedani]RKS75244.1 hypothetical protein CLV35_1703 [Motilibacter peucedani]